MPPKAITATKSKAKAKPKPKKAANTAAEEEEAPSASSRPIWKGAISFGLVTIPVALYSLERKFDLHFRLLDSRDKSGIRYERVNESTGKEVPWDRIVKAFEYSKGNYVVLSNDDFDKAAIESSQAIEITDFVDRASVDDTFFEKPYVVVPGKKTEKGYVLLREVLEKKGKVGIAKVAIRTREHLAAVMPKGDALVVMLLRFAQELKPLSQFDLPKGELSTYRVTDREVELAEQLVEAMTSEWEPKQYKDEYRESLLEWIEKRAEEGELTSEPEPTGEKPTDVSNVVDLASLLRESMRSSTKKPARKKAG